MDYIDEFNIVDKIKDFDTVKERLSVRILNPDIHSKMLEGLITKPFLDLSVTFAVNVIEKENVRGIVRVTNELADIWGVTADDMLKAALKNERGSGEFCIDKLFNTLGNMAADNPELKAEMENVEHFKNLKMYTICEKTFTNGSAGILMNDLLEDFSKKVDSDIIILPSSINELVCITDDSERDYNWLKMIVKEINDTSVPHEEILSYSVYRYSREEDAVSIVA
jgi:hypothetical protein